MGKSVILFIDDDSSLQTLAGAMLNSNLFEVLAAANTEEADEILASRAVDLVVCDVLMPHEDGFRYYERLRRKGFRKPFLFLSAVGDARTVHRGVETGANDYLVKPFDIRELEKKILAILGRPRSPAAVQKTPPKKFSPFRWFRR
jgi:DNA-binding response OmpR family regulator